MEDMEIPSDEISTTGSLDMFEREPAPVLEDDIVTVLKSRIQTSKNKRDDLAPAWKTNVDMRLGEALPGATMGVAANGDLQSEINPDWALTKAKTANLFSHVPAVQITHENKQYMAAIPPFTKALNYELSEKRANVGVAMEEVLNDCVNAAGVGALVVTYVARFEDVPMPMAMPGFTGTTSAPLMGTGGGGGTSTGMPPEAGTNVPLPSMPLVTSGGTMTTGGLPGVVLPAPPQQTTMVPRVVSDKFAITRISPTDLLWPADFTGSNFDNADWIGYSGRMSWAEAKNEFKLTDADKTAVIKGAEPDAQTDLRKDPEHGAVAELRGVRYDRIFYWRYRVDPDEKCLGAIWEMVVVEGKNKPVVHKPWMGQKKDPATKKYAGATRFPVRVLTLTYITDNPIPPSDSQAGRPQVNDMRRSRSQMFQNRERSVPIRWYDHNRVDPLIAQNLMQGTVQGMIPTNGDGSRSIGEVARASYPSEDLAFDRQAMADLMQTWQMSPEQLGMPVAANETKAGIQATQANFAARMGQERTRVASFFLGAVEVMAGLIALYSDFPSLSQEERAALQASWNLKAVVPDLVLKIRPDSTVVLDSQQRVARLLNVLNMTVKSGLINPEPIIMEILELSDLDPSEIMKKPDPPKPEDPNISYRFTGATDLQNPVVMAMLVKAKQAPSPEDLVIALKILSQAQKEMDPSIAGPAPSPEEKPVDGEDQMPGYALGNRVAKRSRDISGG